MKGNQKIIDLLNTLLISELTAIVQYRFNAAYNSTYGYDELSEIFYERAADEQKHYNHLQDRILLLEGLPSIGYVDNPKESVDIRSQLENDLALENDCIEKYNNAVHFVCCDQVDNETRRILEKILKDEVEHAQELEGLIKKCDDMTTSGFLQTYGK